MEKQINEKWLQFCYFSTKGNKIYKTALKFPFHAELTTDQEISINILGRDYNFTCVGDETKTNHDGTVDKIYLVATNYQ